MLEEGAEEKYLGYVDETLAALVAMVQDNKLKAEERVSAATVVDKIITTLAIKDTVGRAVDGHLEEHKLDSLRRIRRGDSSGTEEN